MLTTTFFHWCQARVIARDEGGDTSIPSSFACPDEVEELPGSKLAVLQLIDENSIGVTVRFEDNDLDSIVQEWDEEEEIE